MTRMGRNGWFGWLAGCALLLAGTGAQAWSSFGFAGSYSYWNATDIVVVDAEGRIAEVWAGDERPGAVIPLEALGISAHQICHPEPDGLYLVDGNVTNFAADLASDVKPREIQADRMILFLKKSPAAGVTNGQWEVVYPSYGVSGAKYSPVWVAQNVLYNWQGRYMHDPYLTTLKHDDQKNPVTLAELHYEVLETLRIRTQLRQTVQIADPAARAQALVAFVNPERGECLEEALKHLADCGAAALPVFRQVLDDPGPMHRYSGQILPSLMKAGGEKAKPVLLGIISADVKYWAEAGGRLKPGWGLGINPDSERLDRLAVVIEHLEPMKLTPDEIKLVAKLWEVIRPLPTENLPASQATMQDYVRQTLSRIVQRRT